MRLLAFSDIHHNLAAVKKLRASERNSFDVIVVAGDIGSASAKEFFEILGSFSCPVLYVFGNWDHELSYQKIYGENCHLIHANVVTLGSFHFTGFSGCPTNWGKNPIARRMLGKVRRADQAELKEVNRAILELNRESVRKAVRGAAINPRKCIIITHERLARLSEYLPGTLLHLYGHIHHYSDQIYRGTRYIDVATLDRLLAVRPRSKKKWTVHDCRNVNAGNYVRIEINSSHEIAAQCVHLQREYPNWIPLDDSRLQATDPIPEEKSGEIV
jgi:Calcineurin-like phosphoesterase superfamily domain